MIRGKVATVRKRERKRERERERFVNALSAMSIIITLQYSVSRSLKLLFVVALVTESEPL